MIVSEELICEMMNRMRLQSVSPSSSKCKGCARNRNERSGWWLPMMDSHLMTNQHLAMPLMIFLALCLCTSAWAQDEIPRPLTLQDAFRIALERNPLVDISELQRVVFVMRDGVVYRAP